jgi:hypothetical protein
MMSKLNATSGVCGEPGKKPPWIKVTGRDRLGQSQKSTEICRTSRVLHSVLYTLKAMGHSRVNDNKDTKREK